MCECAIKYVFFYDLCLTPKPVKTTVLNDQKFQISFTILRICTIPETKVSHEW